MGYPSRDRGEDFFRKKGGEDFFSREKGGEDFFQQTLGG